MQNDKWHQPDSAWKSFGCKTFEEYLSNFLIEGKFHSKVPKDIVDSYKTVEYLMAHAYYCYTMYDDALKRLMGIFEIAIKQKCKKMGIAVTFIGKNEKKQDKSLSTLVDQIVKKTRWKELKGVLHRLRKLRNITHHSDTNQIMGGLVKNAVPPTINVLNELFLEGNWLEELLEKKKQVQNQFSSLKDGLFILNHKGDNILVYDIEPITSLKTVNGWVNCWIFNPVLSNAAGSLSNRNRVDPIVYYLQQEEKINDGLTFFNLINDEKIILTKTIKPINTEIFEKHKADFKKADIIHLQLFEQKKFNSINMQIERFMYENCWE